MVLDGDLEEKKLGDEIAEVTLLVLDIGGQKI